MPLPELAAATCAELKQVLPDFATIDNPLDITAQGMQKPSLFGDSAQAMLRDPKVGALLVAAMGGSPAQQMAKWKSMRPVLETAEKPVALAYMGDSWPLSDEFLAEVKRQRRAVLSFARAGHARLCACDAFWPSSGGTARAG